jgi:hypothetical protein
LRNRLLTPLFEPAAAVAGWGRSQGVPAKRRDTRTTPLRNERLVRGEIQVSVSARLTAATQCLACAYVKLVAGARPTSHRPRAPLSTQDRLNLLVHPAQNADALFRHARRRKWPGIHPPPPGQAGPAGIRSTGVIVRMPRHERTARQTYPRGQEAMAPCRLRLQ